MLRIARALGRAGFLWSDTCADPDRDPMRWVPSLWGGNDTDCGFDAGAFVRAFGGLDWQWSGANRVLVEARHGKYKEHEVVLSYSCHEPPSLFCTNSTFHYVANGSLAVAIQGEDAPAQTFAFLRRLDHVPWIRIESTHMRAIPPAPLPCPPSAPQSAAFTYVSVRCRENPSLGLMP